MDAEVEQVSPRKTFGKGVDDSWKKIQERVFTNWINDRLRGNLKVAKKQVKNLGEDLQDGLLLVELLNRLAVPKAIERWNKTPRGKVHSIENLGIVLNFCTQQNIKLVNIGPEDIYGGNLKLILGLIWTLIGEYQIKSSGKAMSTKKAMMGWTNTVIPEYLITNFNTDWNDGRAVCGMVDRIRPGLCPNHFALDKSHGLENCKLGMDLAEQHLDIPKVLSPEDMNNPEVDDLSLMTYLSYFCNPYNSLLLHWIRQKIPQRNIKNLSTDWNNGTNLGALSEACFPGVCPHWEAMDPANAIQNNEEMIGLIKERLGIDCPVSAVELADPKMDEIVVATYLHHFRNANSNGQNMQEQRIQEANTPLAVGPQHMNTATYDDEETNSPKETHSQADLHTAMMDSNSLKPYIRKATATGKELGSGTYGSVIELMSAREKVAGKVYKISSTAKLQAVANRVCGELILMAQLHHPNIVQCKGVCFLADQPLPVLLMELLTSSLYAYILDNSNLSVQKKVSILHDTASGLDFLHGQTPAVVHRDLTANNVLLDSQQRAKIADFGNSRIIDLDPGATPETLTSLPGTLVYMPPEAQGTEGSSVAYDPSLDVFSFGHLSLFTVIQTPVPLLPPTYHDHSTGKVHGRSEVRRREKFIEEVKNLFSENHSLVLMIKQCLHNNPAQRPHTGDLITTLQQLSIALNLQHTLGIDDLTDVKGELLDVAYNWRSIGEALKLKPGSLNIIQANHPGDVKGCLTEVLSEWLQNGYDTTRFGPPSWKLLVAAVAHPAGGNNRALAEKIAQKYNVPTSF